MSRSLILMFSLFCCALAADVSTKIYIVYLGSHHGESPDALVLQHHGILATATGSSVEVASEAMVYSYKHAFSGFSARMTAEQARSISALPEVIHVYPSGTLELLTTRSWDFLQFTETASPGSVLPDDDTTGDVIIGLIDTGIWPEAKSFSEEGLGPVPSRWKGACVNPPGTNASEVIACNKKIVGARYYNADFGNQSTPYKNARDGMGHGTHTSSTAAGRSVSNVSFAGFPKGVARGGAPHAKVAMYKVCWTSSCGESDILAAFDDAVHDGVDIISISIGGLPSKYNVDTIAIGAFHASRQGILVAAAAGNSGPRTVTNAAPWFITVGASTIDRMSGMPIPYKPAPAVPSFSSTGPNIINMDIIKPDVTAPGVKILAAWPSESDTEFESLSGTSMATPHVAGTAVYLKSKYPTWSPAAIRSAIMTTATNLDNTNKTIGDIFGNPLTVFSYGSGLIQPAKSVNPGLVYETEVSDYVSYLCSINYTTPQVQNITGNKSDECPDKPSIMNLNYPSIALANLTGNATIQRVVTNVGPPSSIYKVQVEKPSDEALVIAVNPSELTFKSAGDKQVYEVTFTSTRASESVPTWVFSSLTWTDGVHSVRSPIAVSIV